MRNERLKDDPLLDMLKLMAPGTSLREGLENILRARTGALIVIGDSEECMKLVDGGFFINKEFSPAHLYELAKMDGAIILSEDLKKILYANALLIPDPSIETYETGTRHKTAERSARQTGKIVICISQRRNIISVYKGSKKYILKESASILTKANQALQTLEKYKLVLNNATLKLNKLELDDAVTLYDVAFYIQRFEMFMRIVSEIDRYIIELGNEGRLISMQLEELLTRVLDEATLVIEDYYVPTENRTVEDVLKSICQISYADLMDLSQICRSIGYYVGSNSLDVSVSPKGCRMLDKIPRLPPAIIRKLVDEFKTLKAIRKATIAQLDDVEGVGEVRARAIMDGLKRLQEEIARQSI